MEIFKKGHKTTSGKVDKREKEICCQNTGVPAVRKPNFLNS
jgi:hypothetical protein